MTADRLYTFFKQCIHQRTRVHDFEEYFNYVSRKWDTSSARAATCLVKCAVDFCPPDDPLIALYIQTLLRTGHITKLNLLVACMQRWQRTVQSEHVSLSSCHKVLVQLVAEIVRAEHNQSPRDVRASIILMARWLLAMFQIVDSQSTKARNDELIGLVGAVSIGLTSLLDGDMGIRCVRSVEHNRDDILNKTMRLAISSSMHTSPDVSMQLMARAEKFPALLEVNEHQHTHERGAAVAAFQFESGIAQATVLPSRAATYCLLYCKIYSSSTIHDTSLLNFLNLRYPGDQLAMMNELLFASFDLANKSIHKDVPLFRAQCNLYIIEKLPGMLKLLDSMGNIGKMDIDSAFEQIWNDGQAMNDPSSIAVIRNFLHVSTLYGLTAQGSVQKLIGDDDVAVTPSGLFDTQKLIQQVSENAARGVQLAAELAKQSGNAGPISQALVHAIRALCQAKETQHLKDIANAIISRPETINKLALFTKPGKILMPLCSLLDEWSWDIHGESQPIYEEFGSILLLILIFKYRLNLKDTEIGISSTSGFMAQYSSSGHMERPLSALGEADGKHLAEWIENLFYSEGVSDDVTTNCSAKEFYSLIPTLLEQSVMAFERNALSKEKLEGGLDYLLEPFLLPSLLPALIWLAKKAEAYPKSVTVMVRRLLKSPDNAESGKLHQTIRDIAHSSFRQALFRVADKAPYNELLGLFGDRSDFAMDNRPSAQNLVHWKGNEGGLMSCMRQAVTELNTIPYGGTFQPLLTNEAAVQRGPKAVLTTMLDHLVQLAQSHEFNRTLDIISTIVASSWVNTISLRTTLQLMHADLGRYIKQGDPLFAQALVHLHRQTEGYVSALADMGEAEGSAILSLPGAILANLNLDQITDSAASASKTVTVTQQVQPEPAMTNTFDQMFDTTMDTSNLDDYGGGDFLDFEGLELQNLGDLDMSEFN